MTAGRERRRRQRSRSGTTCSGRSLPVQAYWRGADGGQLCGGAAGEDSGAALEGEGRGGGEAWAREVCVQLRASAANPGRASRGPARPPGPHDDLWTCPGPSHLRAGGLGVASGNLLANVHLAVEPAHQVADVAQGAAEGGWGGVWAGGGAVAATVCAESKSQQPCPRLPRTGGCLPQVPWPWQHQRLQPWPRRPARSRRRAEPPASFCLAPVWVKGGRREDRYCITEWRRGGRERFKTLLHRGGPPRFAAAQQDASCSPPAFRRPSHMAQSLLIDLNTALGPAGRRRRASILTRPAPVDRLGRQPRTAGDSPPRELGASGLGECMHTAVTCRIVCHVRSQPACLALTCQPTPPKRTTAARIARPAASLAVALLHLVVIALRRLDVSSEPLETGPSILAPPYHHTAATSSPTWNSRAGGKDAPAGGGRTSSESNGTKAGRCHRSLKALHARVRRSTSVQSGGARSLVRASLAARCAPHRRAAHLRGAVLPEVCLGKDSLRVQVRLRTSVPAAESGSAQK